MIEQILFADRELKTIGGALANPQGVELEPNDIAPANSEISVVVHNTGEVPAIFSVSFNGNAPELKVPWCIVGTKPPLPPGEVEGKRSPWSTITPGERVTFRHTTQRALSLTRIFLMTMPVPTIVEKKPRTWSLCEEHRRTLDSYARAFPPAIETAEAALPFLFFMADDEALQAVPPSCPACAIGEDRPEDADYACLRAVRCALPPDAVPIDVVLTVVQGPEFKVGEAMIEPVSDDRFLVTVCMTDHRENPLPPMKLEAFASGPARTGKHLRFVLTQIASNVWKLAPSLNVPGVVRAFLTFVSSGP